MTLLTVAANSAADASERHTRDNPVLDTVTPVTDFAVRNIESIVGVGEAAGVMGISARIKNNACRVGMSVVSVILSCTSGA